MSTDKKPIFCPKCKKPTVYSLENPHRPFCSERCKTIDLGDWADEKYAIPTKEIVNQNDDDDFHSSQGPSGDSVPWH